MDRHKGAKCPRENPWQMVAGHVLPKMPFDLRKAAGCFREARECFLLCQDATRAALAESDLERIDDSLAKRDDNPPPRDAYPPAARSECIEKG